MLSPLQKERGIRSYPPSSVKRTKPGSLPKSASFLPRINPDSKGIMTMSHKKSTGSIKNGSPKLPVLVHQAHDVKKFVNATKVNEKSY